MDRSYCFYPLWSAAASTTVDALRILFASFGLPTEVVSDNGPQFTAQDFKDFCVNNGIKRMLIPPYHRNKKSHAGCKASC